MSDDFWTEFESDRWSPTNVGDAITGFVTKREITEAHGKRVPLLTLRVDDQGNEREVAASQTMLKQALAELNVQVGDKLRITLVELKNTGQPQPMKVFQVDHRAAAAVTAQAPPPPPEPPQVDGQDLSEHSNEPF